MLIKIITMDPSWIQEPNSWMVGALTYASTVPQDEKHVGLYTDGVNVMRFEIQRHRIMQQTPNQVLRISPFEVKVFDTRRGIEEIWQETWGLYMDGITPVWVKESANINYKFPIPHQLMPVNHAAFFRKVFRDVRAMHFDGKSAKPTHRSFCTEGAFLMYCARAGIDLRRPVSQLKNPDASLTPVMVNFCIRLGEFYAKHEILSTEQARALMFELTVIWMQATGRMNRPGERSPTSNEEQYESDRLAAINGWLDASYKSCK